MAPILPALIFVTSTAAGNMSVAEMEKAYWDCEFTATQGTIDLDAAVACNEIFEQLKTDRFQGDFHRFLAWWQKNKDREISSRMMPRKPVY